MTSEMLPHRVEGAGQPLLLLNGVAMTMSSWQPVVAALPSEFQIIRCDLRGQLMAPVPPPDTLGRHADDVAHVLRALKLGPVRVAGTSFGAAVAVHLAARHSRLVQDLTLLTAVDRATPEMEREVQRWCEACEAVLGGRPGEHLLEVMTPTTFSPQWIRANLERWTEHRRAMNQLPPSFFEGLAALLATVPALDVDDVAGTVGCRALVVAAKDDRFMPLKRTRALADRLPDAVFCVLSGAGHAAVMERPEAVAEVIAAGV